MFEGILGKKEPEGGFKNEKPMYVGENVVDPATGEVVKPEELKKRNEGRASSGREQV
ncbi:MAG: hypothetical protein Q7S11_00910 [bacterium]|nr:hypothetical protein [bacterium]